MDTSTATGAEFEHWNAESLQLAESTFDAQAETLADDAEPHAQCWRGADLLKLAINDLVRLGYRKTAIDTWRHDELYHNVRHSYSGGRWNLTCWHDGQATPGNVSWPDHTSMRRVARLLRGMLPTALAAGQHWPGGDGPLG